VVDVTYLEYDLSCQICDEIRQQLPPEIANHHTVTPDNLGVRLTIDCSDWDLLCVITILNNRVIAGVGMARSRNGVYSTRMIDHYYELADPAFIDKVVTLVKEVLRDGPDGYEYTRSSRAKSKRPRILHKDEY
jgi:hypothetical protein